MAIPVKYYFVLTQSLDLIRSHEISSKISEALCIGALMTVKWVIAVNFRNRPIIADGLSLDDPLDAVNFRNNVAAELPTPP